MGGFFPQRSLNGAWLGLMLLAAGLHFASFEVVETPIELDVAFFLYFAERAAQGAVPNVDFLEYKTPLAIFVGAWAYRTGCARTPSWSPPPPPARRTTAPRNRRHRRERDRSSRSRGRGGGGREDGKHADSLGARRVLVHAPWSRVEFGPSARPRQAAWTDAHRHAHRVGGHSSAQNEAPRCRTQNIATAPME